MRTFGLVVMVALVGCKKPAEGGAAGAPGTTRLGLQQAAPRVPSLGTRRVEGAASDLRLSPSGKAAVALLDAETPSLQGVPPSLKLGALWLVPMQGDKAVKIANGVSNAPGGLLFSDDGKYLLTLGGFDPQQQHGDLFIVDLDTPGEERTAVARRVTYLLASPDSAKVAYVSDSVLHFGAMPKGPFRQLAGEVATAEFSPDSKHLYFRRRVSAGGGLYQVDLTAEKSVPKRLFDSVGEFAVTHDSRTVVAMARSNPAQFGFELHVADAATLKSRKVSDDVMRFALSRDAKWLSFMRIPSTLSTAKGGGMNPQDLQMGELVLAPLSGGEGRVVGQRVRDFEFS
ncbi:MAG: hypothetical protein JNG84_11210, partial [Archangium sp.]|nr:hypothetical protein [Archangium sp.]